VENRGFWALEAPPKREKQMNTRGPIYRLAGHWSAFERTTSYLHSNAPVICGRTQCARSTANNCCGG
jgi:hypothetical protein